MGLAGSWTAVTGFSPGFEEFQQLLLYRLAPEVS